MKTSYLPSGDLERVNWLNNFKTRMSQYGAQLGFTAAEITAAANDAAMFQYIVNLKEGCKAAMQSLVALTRNLRNSPQVPMGAIPVLPVAGTAPASVLAGIFNRVSLTVARIKQHSNYTDAIGQEFDIIAPVSSFNPAAAKPVLKARVESGYPRLSWSRGQADGICLYVDRRDGAGFVLLDKLVRTNYIDITPLPANTFSVTWDYRARYMIDDDEIGLMSDTVTVSVVRV